MIPLVRGLSGVVTDAYVAYDEVEVAPSTPPGGVMSTLCDSASIAIENLGWGLCKKVLQAAADTVLYELPGPQPPAVGFWLLNHPRPREVRDWELSNV